MDKIFKALADTNRRKILTILKSQNLSVNEMLKYLGVKQPTLSSHLAILRKAKLVSFQIKGKQRIYKLNREELISFVDELNKFAEFRDIKLVNEIIVRRI